MPGWTHFGIHPRLGKLKWAEGRIPTPHGPITVHAEAGDEYRLEVKIPVGTTASVIIPARSREAVTVPAPAKLLLFEDSRAGIDVPAGNYKFRSRLNN